MTNYEAKLKRIGDCRALYLKYGGENHELIEQEMRAMGHTDFHRRVLYRRFERDRCSPGWIESYGFDSLVWEQKQKAKLEGRPYPPTTPVSVPPAVAGGLTPAEPHISTVSRVERGDQPSSPSHLPFSSSPLLPLSSSPGRDSAADFEQFRIWLNRVSPGMNWTWKHLVYIYKQLSLVTTGEIKRLMVYVPPRHGKSELVTVRYAAWRLKNDPSMNVIIGSYNQQLANRFSRKIKRVLGDDAELLRIADRGSRIDEDEHVAATKTATTEPTARNRATGPSEDPRSAIRDPRSTDSPFPFVSQKPINTVAEWETKLGGGLRAVGVGGGVTGFGANLIIIDDPIKSRAEAESKAYRDRIWQWFNDDIYTRLEPDGAIVLIQTRWHEDDLAGRLLKEAAEAGEQWTVINLPALAEGGELRIADRGSRIHNDETYDAHTTVATRPAKRNIPNYVSENPQSAIRIPQSDDPQSNDPLDRLPGEALCPERYDAEYLLKLQKRIGTYSFASLYQQRPVPAEGGMFKRKWFEKIVDQPPYGLRWKRGYDLGVSANATADFTASFRVAFDKSGDMYIDGGFRERIEYPDQRRYILGRIAAERDTEHGVELAANGEAVIAELRRDHNLLGRAFRGIRVKGGKTDRALAWQALAEEGRVYLVRGHWNRDFVDEICSFPSGTHDDQVDAVSLAVRMHRNPSSKLYRF